MTRKDTVLEERQKSVDALVLSTINYISRNRAEKDSSGVPYIQRVLEQRRTYHETIRAMCEIRGTRWEHLISLFDDQLEKIIKEYNHPCYLPDLTANSPVPEIPSHTQDRS